MPIMQFEIPLVSSPQTFPILIQGRLLSITCRWNAQGEFWKLDIFDSNTEEVLILGVPLYNGVDLLGQYPNAGIGGFWFIYSATNFFNDPTYYSLGRETALLVDLVT